MDAPKAIGRALRDLRKDLSLTQADVAQQLGVRENTVGDDERGTWGGALGRIGRYLDIYHQPLDRLLLAAADQVAGEGGPGRYARLDQLIRTTRGRLGPEMLAHAFAMLAKELVFRAQDHVRDIEDRDVARDIEQRLGEVRELLESIDRAWGAR